jgi:hypothetical protein
LPVVADLAEHGVYQISQQVLVIQARQTSACGTSATCVRLAALSEVHSEADIALVSERRMVPQEGFEPPTYALRMRRSTS